MPPNIKRLPLAPLPAALQSIATPNDLYKHLISQALKHATDVTEGDYRNLPTQVFSLSPTMLAAIEQVAAEHFDNDLKAAFTALSRAGAKIAMAQREAATKTSAPDTQETDIFSPKSELQRSFFTKITDSLKRKRIVFAEASTGIGKGRALVAAAALKAMQLEPGQLTVVCGPTVNIVEQLYKEALALNHHQINFTILCGASEFVDDLLLTAFLENNPLPELDPVRNWVATGARPLNPSRPLVQSIGDAAAWLHDDLAHLCEGIEIDIDSFTLTQDIDADSESRKIVQNIRLNVKNDAQVVFCTHAMLAFSQRTQWRFLPPPSALLIDEAHLFEQQVSNVNSSKLSMFTLRSALATYKRKHKLTATHQASVAHKASVELSKVLTELGKESDGSTMDLSHISQHAPQTLMFVTNQLNTILGALKHKSMKDFRLTPGFIKSLSIIHQNLQRMHQVGLSPLQRTYLSFSPNRLYPSLIGGPISVAAQLGGIWKAAHEGAVLASATLYTPTETGDLKCDYMRSVLNTPLPRTDIIQPIIDPYLFTAPTLHHPSQRSAHMFRYGTTEDDKKRWISTVAETIEQKVLPTSKGGTLVLLTSYTDIGALQDELQKNPDIKQRLICMERGISLNSKLHLFRTYYEQGVMPILLALGPAWTGLDLTLPDVPAEYDFLLTALVICRTPVGINDSNTMRQRIMTRGMLPVAQEAALTFKQGAGRLIRRNGVKNRHLWVLDGRIFDGKPWSVSSANNRAFTSLSSSLRRFLKKYKNAETF